VDDWMRICRLDELPVLGARVVERPESAGGNIAIFRIAADRVFALRDRCPHKGGPLSQGIVYGERVACPLHNWSIELNSGCAVAPDEGCAQRFPTRVDAGMVYLGLGSDLSESASDHVVEQVGAND
jgi:nitrite reductase (NADH) small subunit